MFDKERYILAIERILQIPDEKTVEEPFLSYFHRVAKFIAYVHEVFEREHCHEKGKDSCNAHSKGSVSSV